MSRLPITLVVMTYNEADNIARCLDSVPFAAEKVVIDSGSTDATCAIAQAHGARVVQQSWLGFGPQRNFSTSQANHDWILFLDADEHLSAELIAELAARLPALLESTHAGAIVKRATWYMGGALRWYRPMVAERHGRIYHRHRARWTDVRVHESVRFNGTTITLQAPLYHHHNPTLVHEQLKLLRYSELKARDWLDRGRPSRLWECPIVFLATFLKDYLLRLAILDGARGYILAHTAATYAVYKRLRYFEMKYYAESRQAAQEILHRHGLDR